MNRKISRNEKHKYSNEEKLALVENENTSALTNIAQENDCNISELLQNFGINNLRFLILKCSRFIIRFVFILLLLYTQMFSSLEKERKKQFKSPPLPPTRRLLKISVFSNPHPLTIPISPTISLSYFFQPLLLFHTPVYRKTESRYDSFARLKWM